MIMAMEKRQRASDALRRELPHPPFKVLLAIDQFWGPHGGTEQNLLFLCNLLPATGAGVELAALSHLSSEISSLISIPVHAPESRKSVWGAGFLKKAWWLSRIIKSRQIDIVHAFCPVSEFAAALATRMAGRGAVIGSRRNVGYWHTPGTRWRARFVTRFVSHFVANCQAAKQAAFQQEWIDGDRISVIVNPLNPNRFNIPSDEGQTRQALGIAREEKIVVIVATVRPVKDHETFLRAATIVLQDFPATRFLIVGDEVGEYPKKIRSLASELGIGHQVSFLGPVANPFPILRIADIGVLCSSSEGFSNALLEYAVAGLPSVATDVGGLPEVVIDGDTGYLVPAGSPERLADRIGLLLSDGSLRAKIGSNARLHALKWNDPEKIVQSYLSVYSQQLTRR